MSVAAYDTPRNSAAYNDTRAPWKRVTPHAPCEVCGAKKYCEYTDGGVFHCMNEDAARARGGRPYNYRGGGFLITADERRPQTIRPVPSQPELAQIAATPVPEPERVSDVADVDTLHAVYTSLLELCPLVKAHRALLTGDGHGLTIDQARRYGTLPRDARAVCAELEQRHGRDTLLSVPGFTQKDGRIEARGAGIIMPTRDTHGRIVAIDVRRERAEVGEAKYFKLSCGSIGGPNAGTPPHIAQPSELRDARTVYVTEGVKKSDVAADALGCVVIGVAGHNTWSRAVPLLDELAEGGADVCIIALDRDSKPETVAAVDATRRKLAAAVAAMGYAVRLSVWDAATAKGLDDLLQAGLSPMREVYRPEVGHSDEYAQLKAENEELRAYKDHTIQLLTQKDMRPALKVIAFSTWHVARQLPGLRGDALPEPRPVYRARIAELSGVSEGTVSDGLRHLKALGIVQHRTKTDPQTKITELFVGAGQWPETPWTAEELDSPRHAKDRARKVCRTCGSAHLKVHSYECEDCGAISTVEQASDAGEAAARAAHVAERERFMREDADGERQDDDELPESATAAEAPGQTTVDARGRVIDVATGEVLHSAPATPPVSDEPQEWDEDRAVALYQHMAAAISPVYEEGGERPGQAVVHERLDAAWDAHEWDLFARNVNAMLALYDVHDEPPRRCSCGRMAHTACAGECPFNGVSEVLS